jgi:hypothetical protein
MVEWFSPPLLFIEGYSSFLNYPRYIDSNVTPQNHQKIMHLNYSSEYGKDFFKIKCLILFTFRMIFACSYLIDVCFFLQISFLWDPIN